MPKVKHLDWEKFIAYNMEQQNIAEFQAELNDLDGRGLYELETYSLFNRYLIDRPANYAFHRTIINYPVDPVDIMRDCLIDGQVILRVEDAEHIKIEEFVSRATWADFTDDLNFIEIKYVYEETNKQDYYHVEHYIKNPDGTATWIVFKPVSPQVPEREWVIDFEMELPIFPYVGIRWVFNQSFLSPLKQAIVRLETAYRTIGAENIDRMGLALYLEGITNVEDIKTAPRKMGRRVHILPKDSKFHSPSPDAPGMALMVEELNRLETAIEKASGVVSTERLATLSGVSRSIAEKPLIMLADELRGRFTKGMTEVVELAKVAGGAEDLKVSYRPLRHIEDKNVHLTTLDKARELNDEDPTLGITIEEYSIELRLLLDLGPETGK